MFYRVALSEKSSYNVARTDNGEWFYIPGELQPFHRDEFTEITPLDVPVVRYQDKTPVKIGDRCETIDGSFSGVVDEIHHPRGCHTSGRVKLHNGKELAAGICNKL